MIVRRMTRRRGVTLTELLVVLAIIGLLATIAVPVYVNKMEQAKVSTAKHEVLELANAEEICGIMHGHYVPLYMLDDLPYRAQGRPTSVDDIENTKDVIDPYLISTGIPINDGTTTDQESQQARLSDEADTISIKRLYLGWQGPFANFKRYYMGFDVYVEPPNPDPNDVARDYPLDPWGNPYLMLTELGLVDFDGRITNDELDHNFDRMTILSMGPDGNTVYSATTLTVLNPSGDDDIWVHFGASGIYPETFYGGGPFGSPSPSQ